MPKASNSDAHTINNFARKLRDLEKLLVEDFGIAESAAFQIMWVVLTIGIKKKFSALGREGRDRIRARILESTTPHTVQRARIRQLH